MPSVVLLTTYLRALEACVGGRPADPHRAPQQNRPLLPATPREPTSESDAWKDAPRGLQMLEFTKIPSRALFSLPPPLLWLVPAPDRISPHSAPCCPLHTELSSGSHGGTSKTPNLNLLSFFISPPNPVSPPSLCFSSSHYHLS